MSQFVPNLFRPLQTVLIICARFVTVWSGLSTWTRIGIKLISFRIDLTLPLMQVCVELVTSARVEMSSEFFCPSPWPSTWASKTLLEGVVLHVSWRFSSNRIHSNFLDQVQEMDLSIRLFTIFGHVLKSTNVFLFLCSWDRSQFQYFWIWDVIGTSTFANTHVI